MLRMKAGRSRELQQGSVAWATAAPWALALSGYYAWPMSLSGGRGACELPGSHENEAQQGRGCVFVAFILCFLLSLPTCLDRLNIDKCSHSLSFSLCFTHTVFILWLMCVPHIYTVLCTLNMDTNCKPPSVWLTPPPLCHQLLSFSHRAPRWENS